MSQPVLDTRRVLCACVFLILASGFSTVTTAQALPVCVDPTSDSNGDGFGWENLRSCRMPPGRPAQITQCLSANSDSDGDGYGWENGTSCRVVASLPTTPSATIPNCISASSDSNGDGFGWENGNSCRVLQGSSAPPLEEKYPIPQPACSDPRYDSDGDGFGWENSRSCRSHNVGDGGRSITDVILVTGQSNALGAETATYDPASYDLNLDSPVKRVYVYTNTGWSIASLRQIWDLNWYPRADISGAPANNFAFHFAKTVALQDSQKVVGLILTTAPGEQISHWDKNGSFYPKIASKVNRALSALSHKSSVDAVLWHQGETDFYDTAYYGSRLDQLISNLRGEIWVRWNAPFICGETYNAPVNQRLMALNNNNDPRSACVTSRGLDTVGDDIHFSAKSLRVLGFRYATKYLKILAN